MEALVADQDDGLVDALIVGMAPGELERGLVGLGPRVAEEHTLVVGERGEALAQRLLLRDAVVVGYVHEGMRLLGDRPGDLGMRVTQPADGDAGEGVQVLVAVAVPYPRAGALDQGHREPVVGGHQSALAHGAIPQMKKAAQGGRISA